MNTKCSLLLLSYNQEKYIAAAVRGALSQRYSPLEIIISDDASSDKTFPIAKEIVNSYTGPHEVILNRNPKNLGIIPHTNKLISRATGEILIPAYGDDISYPHRVARLASCFATKNSLLVHSYADPICGNGKPTTSRYRKASFFHTTNPLAVATSLSHYLGASGAWSRSLFETYGPIQSELVYDDHILGFRAALEGRISLISEPLLQYRQGIGVSHQNMKDLTRSENRLQRIRLLTQAKEVFAERLKDAKTFGLDGSDPIVKKLERAIINNEIRLSYYQSGSLAKLIANPLAFFNYSAKEAFRDILIR